MLSRDLCLTLPYAIALPRTWCGRFVLVTLVMLMLLSGRPALAQSSSSDREPSVEYPLILVTAHSIDRMLERMDRMFAAGQREDMAKLARKGWEENLKGLKGMDLKRPFGQLFYIRSGLTPELTVLFFIPISNREEFFTTIGSFNQQTVVPVSGKTGRYKIEGNGETSNYLQQVGDYVVVTVQESDQYELDRKFPDLEKLAGRVTNRYDVGASLLLSSVPPALKTLILESMKAAVQGQLQQRDDEPDSQYRLRRASGEDVLNLFDRVFTQADNLTIGGRLENDSTEAVVEAEILGLSDQKLAKYFLTSASRPSGFAAAVEQPGTLTVSMSSLLEQKQRQRWIEFFDAAYKDASKDLSGELKDAGVEAQFETIRRCMVATAENGHLDGFFQFIGKQPGEYGWVGALRVQGSEKLPAEVATLMERVIEEAKPEEAQKPKVGASEHKNYPIHFIPLGHEISAATTRATGDNPGLHVYVTPQAIWLAGGGQAALQALRDRVDAVAKPPTGDVAKRARMPLQVVMRGGGWVEWMRLQVEGEGSSAPAEPEVSEAATDTAVIEVDGTGVEVTRPTALDANGQPLPPGKVEAATPQPEATEPPPRLADAFQNNFKTAMVDGKDTLRAELRPTDNGLKLRIEFGAAYVELLGRQIGAGRDWGEARAAERRAEQARRELEAAANNPPADAVPLDNP